VASEAGRRGWLADLPSPVGHRGCAFSGDIGRRMKYVLLLIAIALTGCAGKDLKSING
jgi:hypothetical protein